VTTLGNGYVDAFPIGMGVVPRTGRENINKRMRTGMSYRVGPGPRYR
jgi:hypothetical protein